MGDISKSNESMSAGTDEKLLINVCAFWNSFWAGIRITYIIQ